MYEKQTPAAPLLSENRADGNAGYTVVGVAHPTRWRSVTA